MTTIPSVPARTPPTAALAAALWLCLLAGPAVAVVDITPRVTTATLTWDGNDIVYTQDYCVESTEEPQGGAIIDYRVTAESPTSLTDGIEQIPATIEWEDLQTGNVVELDPDIATGYDFTGAEQDCPGGNNARIMLTFTQADISSVGPGVYDNRFSIEVANQGRGRNSRDGRIDLDLTIEDSIRISQLNDIDLGTFDGQTDLQGSDTLCVFRASGEDYALTITGDGGGGDFILASNDSEIPISVRWDDGTGAVEVDPGVLLADRTNSFSANQDCDGGAANNATLEVFAPAADVQDNATELGPHVGVLTIMVEMQ